MLLRTALWIVLAGAATAEAPHEADSLQAQGEADSRRQVGAWCGSGGGGCAGAALPEAPGPAPAPASAPALLLPSALLQAPGGPRAAVEAKGPKKKIRKAVRRAIIKLIIIALIIKHKIKMLITAFQTFLGFKIFLLSSLLLLAFILKVWGEIKHNHHGSKIVYYENAHHQHHYEHDPHHDHGHGWGHGWLWRRSLGEDAHAVAYSAHIPRPSSSSQPYLASSPSSHHHFPSPSSSQVHLPSSYSTPPYRPLPSYFQK